MSCYYEVIIHGINVKEPFVFSFEYVSDRENLVCVFFGDFNVTTPQRRSSHTHHHSLTH